jgi:D-alanyl-D-alanine carboxypeptidase
MTFMVINKMLNKLSMNPDTSRIKILVSSTTDILGGTSAQLIAGDHVNITELLYGMMLPSGNDAA